ncbi:MAG: phosphodiesterase [Pseudomonadota bacterium]
MRFLQFTDIHLTTPGETILQRDPNANFEKALGHALADHSDAEALVITGDLSDWGDRDDYERLKARIGALPFPVHLCIGNHDNRENFLSVFPDLANDDGFVQNVAPLGDALAVTLDTKIPDTHAGELCATRLAWLDRTLSDADKPVFLFMHHNPVPTGQGPIDTIMLQNADGFAETIRPYGDKIRHIFFGHCHLPLNGSLHGVPFSAPRGTNHAGGFNFAEPEKLTASDLPESYAVVFASDRSVMVDMVEFGYGGPIHIENTPDYAAWDRETMAR